MGNSKPVADRHYLQTTEEHFARAIAEDQVAHKAAQQPAESARKGSQPSPRNPNFSADCDPLRIYTSLQVAEAGLEPARPIMGTGF